MSRNILVIDLVGLTSGVLAQMPNVAASFSHGSRTVQLEPPLPAVTCSSQATIVTGTLPADHGIVSNGWYFRDSAEIRFWMRSDRLVHGEKVWEAARRVDPQIRTANLFWRYCTHSDCDITITERPTYWANGRKGPDIYTSPGPLRNQLVERLGEFPLFRFWGPATAIAATDWIADATLHVIRSETPHLALAYLPHLDYDLQKYGPASQQAAEAIREVDATTTRLIQGAREAGYEVALLSEYGMTSVSQPIFLNRVLREAGYVTVQHAQNGELLEPGDSKAFAACSHQIAHVYVSDPGDLSAVKQLMQSTPGVERVLSKDDQAVAGLNHSRSGELVAIAAPDCWFAYPYWLDESKAPDFARCVAIHDKPGHDPVEMFFGSGGKAKAMRRLIQNKLGCRVPMDVISLDATLIRGSHGRPPDEDSEAPILLTDWVHESPDKISMTEVKPLLLSRLFRR